VGLERSVGHHPLISTYFKESTMTSSVKPGSQTSHTTHTGPAALAALWLVSVIAASQSGLLPALGRVFMPGYALLVAFGIGLPVLLYFGWPAMRRTVDAIGLHRLTLMHVWRIPAALAFFYYGLRGELPALFWIVAGVGDFMAGAFAATLLWRAGTVARYRRIHVFGAIDFVAAVGLGLTFTLLQDPRMALLTTLPMALIPLFGVGLSGASHIVALSRLARPLPGHHT
jgi:hypothetical protein